MCKVLAYVLFTGLILNYGCGQSTFNTTAYALANPCVWVPCNLSDSSIGVSRYSVTCCSIQVPLNYARSNRTISAAMSRISANATASNQSTIFLLSGGPGGSGWNLFGTAEALISAVPSITVVLPDHRGTGLSAALSCNDNGSQEIDAACLNYLISKWGVEGLNQFSITNAAHDLSVLIQAYQATNSARIGIFAVSYGTLWLDRFLQIYPTLVQAAVMDGVFDPLTSSDSRALLLTNEVAWQFLSNCRLQIKCSQYFTPQQPPSTILQKILLEVDANKQKCINDNFAQYKLTSKILRHIFFDLITDASRYLDRTILPAVIYRLNRCNADDVTVLKYFFSNSVKISSPDLPTILFSKVLAYNIVQSETWLALNESDIDEITYQNWYDSTIVALARPSNYLSLRNQWPKYPLDQYYGKFASQSPVLMLSGTLDPSTVFYQASHIASVTKKTRTFYAIPLAGHVTANIISVGYICPIALAVAHLFPEIVPASFSDPKCVQALPTTIDFVGETQEGRTISSKLLNTVLPFGNGTPSPYNAAPQKTIFMLLHILSILVCYVAYSLFQ